MVEINKLKSEDPEEQAIRDVIKTINLEELVDGNRIFDSNGVSYIKVTRNGEVLKLAVPIRSTGVAEAIDQFERDQRPTPPKKRIIIKPSDDLGKELKITRNEFVSVFDMTDEAYLKDVVKYERDLGLKVLLLGIAIPMKGKDGKEITDDNEKLNVLRTMGITGDQVGQLVKDIRNLTRWEEKRESDFLAE